MVAEFTGADDPEKIVPAVEVWMDRVDAVDGKEVLAGPFRTTDKQFYGQYADRVNEDGKPLFRLTKRRPAVAKEAGRPTKRDLSDFVVE